MEEEPIGVPGHPGKSEWSRMLQEWLRDCGLSFEAEGEATRIMVGQVAVQVAEGEDGGYSVIVSVSLPGRGVDAQGVEDEIARAVRLASRIAGERSLRYDVDQSLPDYPMLYIIVGFEDPYSMAEALTGALEEHCEDGSSELEG